MERKTQRSMNEGMRECLPDFRVKCQQKEKKNEGEKRRENC